MQSKLLNFERVIVHILHFSTISDFTGVLFLLRTERATCIKRAVYMYSKENVFNWLGYTSGEFGQRDTRFKEND